jgi:hypothetical protein
VILVWAIACGSPARLISRKASQVVYATGLSFVSGQFAWRLSADLSSSVFMIFKFPLWFGFKAARAADLLRHSPVCAERIPPAQT